MSFWEACYFTAKIWGCLALAVGGGIALILLAPIWVTVAVVAVVMFVLCALIVMDE